LKSNILTEAYLIALIWTKRRSITKCGYS